MSIDNQAAESQYFGVISIVVYNQLIRISLPTSTGFIYVMFAKLGKPIGNVSN